jgi:hypothetical protein
MSAYLVHHSYVTHDQLDKPAHVHINHNEYSKPVHVQVHVNWKTTRDLSGDTHEEFWHRPCCFTLSREQFHEQPNVLFDTMNRVLDFRELKKLSYEVMDGWWGSTLLYEHLPHSERYLHPNFNDKYSITRELRRILSDEMLALNGPIGIPHPPKVSDKTWIFKLTDRELSEAERHYLRHYDGEKCMKRGQGVSCLRSDETQACVDGRLRWPGGG